MKFFTTVCVTIDFHTNETDSKRGFACNLFDVIHGESYGKEESVRMIATPESARQYVAGGDPMPMACGENAKCWIRGHSMELVRSLQLSWKGYCPFDLSTGDVRAHRFHVHFRPFTHYQ